MNAPREDIYAALFTLLNGLADWKFTDRKYVPISQIGDTSFPAMMMCQKDEQPEVNGRGIPIKWHLNVEVVIYVDTGGDREDMVPAQLLNPLLDTIENAIQPDPTIRGPQTLGGLVSQTRINGKVETDGGVLLNRGWAVVPVEIIVPA
ncbi:MAG TPA: hypothetical protein VN577_10080 [Terriglobales bacterium]|nr:hypothetical protein [Terriglobales bacterium]